MKSLLSDIVDLQFGYGVFTTISLCRPRENIDTWSGSDEDAVTGMEMISFIEKNIGKLNYWISVVFDIGRGHPDVKVNMVNFSVRPWKGKKNAIIAVDYYVF